MNKKALTLFVAATFVVSSFAPFVKAATVDELQAQINALLQQITALQGTTTTTTTTGTSCFTTDLSQGMTSDAVKLLQSKLGVIQTGYFGPLTLAAVKNFQTQYGISPVAGYVGPITRAKLNSLYCGTTTTTTTTDTTSTVPGCAAGALFSATTGASCTTSTVAGCAPGALFSATTGASCTTTPTDTTTATEGTLTAVASPIFVETTIKKGDVQKPILAAKLEAKNSDINLQRVDVVINGTSIQPWKTYTSFDLYINGSLIKSIPAVKENFLENTYATNYTLRFDNISVNIVKSGSADVVLKASAQSNPENTNTATFEFEQNAFRGLDSKGLDQYAVTAAQDSANTFKTGNLAPAAASTGTLTFSLSASSPKAGFIIGNKTATSVDKEIAKFDVKAENRDVTIKTLKVTMTDTGGLTSAIKLYDGTNILASVAGGNGDATFSNLNIVVAKDTTKTLTVKVDLKPIDGSTIAEGLTLVSAITANATQITAIDSSDTMLTNTEITGTSTSKLMTAYTAAPLLTFVSANITKTVQAGQDDQADATIVFDITAQGGDIYFKSNTTLGTILVDDGMGTHNNFTASDGAPGGDDGVGTYTFASTAEVYDANTFLVRSGQTARITISGHVTTVGQTGYTNMALDQLIWGPDATPTEYTIKGITATVNYDLTAFKTNDVSLTRVTAAE